MRMASLTWNRWELMNSSPLSLLGRSKVSATAKNQKEVKPSSDLGTNNHEEVEERALGWRTWKMPTWKSMWANKKTTRLRQQRNLRRKKFKRHWIC
jgi:hypothetical protein